MLAASAIHVGCVATRGDVERLEAEIQAGLSRQQSSQERLNASEAERLRAVENRVSALAVEISALVTRLDRSEARIADVTGESSRALADLRAEDSRIREGLAGAIRRVAVVEGDVALASKETQNVASRHATDHRTLLRRIEVVVEEVTRETEQLRGRITALEGATETGYVHVVRPGETLSTIASRYGVSVAAIRQANGIQNPNLLREGQELFIPVGEASAPGGSASGGP